MYYFKISSLVLLTALYGCGGSDDEKARNFIANGKDYLAENNLIAAKIEFTNALRLDKNSSEALYQLALFSEADKNWPEFEKYLKNLLTIESDHIDGRIKLTHFYMGSNQIDLAKTHSDYLSKIAPQNKEAILARAAVLYKLEKIDKARELIDEILIKEPGNVDAIFLKANDFMQDSKLEDAIALLDKGLKSHPNNLALNMSKIQALKAYGDWEGTLPVYEHLMEIFPNSTAPAASLAQTYMQHGQLEKAIDTMESFAEKNDNPHFYIKAVELVAATKGLTQSEANLKGYIESNPSLTELRFALADIYIQTNRTDLAYSEIQHIKSNANDSDIKHQAMNRLARMDFSTGKEKDARKTINAILKESPDDASALALKSNLLIKDGSADEAIKILRAAMRNNSESAELWLTLGRAHEHQQQWELADENYANSLKLSSGSPLHIIHYSEFLVKRGNIDKAANLLEPLVQSGTQHRKALHLFAQIMLQKENWRKALKTAELLKVVTGNTAEVALIEGYAYEGLNDTPLAIESFKQLYALAPESPKSRGLLVNAYIKANERKEAEKIIAESLQKNDADFSTLMLQGDLFAHYQDWPRAIDSIEKAIQSEPKQLQSYDRLIRILMQTGQTEQAIAAIDKGLVQLPDNVTLSVYKASLYQQVKQPQKSIEIYRKILDKNPDIDTVANNLAVLLQSLGGRENLDRAAKVANRFRQSKIPQFQDTLGWIYSEQGNNEEAVALLRRAADKLKTVGEVQYHLGVAFKRSGKSDQAEKYLESAIILANEQKITAPWVEDAKMVLEAIKD